MGIIIQTGHQSSFASKVMEKLYLRGLNKPRLSHQKALSAEEIADSIDDLFKSDNSLKQKMADSLVVDFLLANHAQKDWGWHHEKNISALTYWQGLEENIRFILVFDHPKYMLEKLLNEDLSKNKLDLIIQEWVDYHNNILTFYKSVGDKCVLIEGFAVVEKFSNLSDKMGSFSHSIEWKSSWQIENETTTTPVETCNMTANVIMEEIYKHYPEMIDIYNNLLNQATSKVSSKISKTKKIDLDDLIASLSELKANKELDVKKIMEDNRLLSIAKLELEQMKANKEAVTKQNNSPNDSLEKENQLLIKQLHQVQEELERYYIENKQLKSKSVSGKSNKQIYYGAADRIKNDLPYRLGQKLVKSKTPAEIIKLPVLLTKEYREFQSNKPKAALPNIEEYKDQHEAMKLKKHLSYKLGKILVDSTQSPKKLFTLPGDMLKEVYQFKKKD